MRGERRARQLSCRLRHQLQEPHRPHRGAHRRRESRFLACHRQEQCGIQACLSSRLAEGTLEAAGVQLQIPLPLVQAAGLRQAQPSLLQLAQPGPVIADGGAQPSFQQ